MPFSLSLSACASWHKSYHLQFPQFLSVLQSKNKQKRIWSHKRKKRNKLAQASKNSTVYHEASTLGTEALMSKNNNSLSSRKSETQVVQD